jgi:hypothetical protein
MFLRKSLAALFVFINVLLTFSYKYAIIMIALQSLKTAINNQI